MVPGGMRSTELKSLLKRLGYELKDVGFALVYPLNQDANDVRSDMVKQLIQTKA